MSDTGDEELRAYTRALFNTDDTQDITELTPEQQFLRTLFRNSN